MMKVVLTKDIKGLGKKDEVVNVSDGYARNYLIPRGMVLEANTARLNEARKKDEAIKNKDEREKAKAIELSKKVENISVTIQVKAGENGKLFGSITSSDISEGLKKQYSIDIDKKKIVLDEPIKHTGEIQVEIRLNHGVTCSLKVKVEASGKG